MRRLLRWAFHGLAAASLLLCLARAALWVRSYWVDYQLYGHLPDASVPFGDHYACFIWSHRGRLEGIFGGYERPEADPIPPWEFRFEQWPARREETWGDLSRFPRRQVYDGFAFYVRTWNRPDGFLVAASAVLPAVVGLRRVRAPAT